MAASAVMQAAGESLWPVMGGVKWMGTYHAAVSTPVESSDVYLGQLSWTGDPHGDVGDGVPRDRRGARRRAVVLGRVRDPGDGARRARDRGAAVRVGDRAGERRRVRRRHAHRGVPAVPVLGDVLPGQPAARLARSRWRCCRRCITPSSCAGTRPRASSTAGRRWSATSSCCSCSSRGACGGGSARFDRKLTQ